MTAIFFVPGFELVCASQSTCIVLCSDNIYIQYQINHYAAVMEWLDRKRNIPLDPVSNLNNFAAGMRSQVRLQTNLVMVSRKHIHSRSV